MTKKILIITAAALGLSGVAYYISILGSEAALMDRFPNHDPKILVKASRQMLLEAWSGKYNDIDTEDDKVLDNIYIAKYMILKYGS